ncbi:cell surface protein precursor [Lactiplantibacillus plantarum]|nr:cell surface protein precursor [Lactiplantibacillus plantarum]MCG0615023.1 cell surface protein precursor [Lactiplantibacillus plantarum]MCG0654377.1 cell surface protein precursor [Lactiplantibacillus plantarum]MCG0711186.1 cell surface protein precursor [Lactiplantibacillus plantarum]
MSKALKIVMGITMLTGGIMAQKMTVHAAESNTRTGSGSKDEWHGQFSKSGRK